MSEASERKIALVDGAKLRRENRSLLFVIDGDCGVLQDGWISLVKHA
jgi:hypothetical protein